MKLMASLALARAEVEAEVVAKADQCLLFVLWAVCNIVQLSAPYIKLRDFSLIPLTPMGVLVPGSVHARPGVEIFRCTCLQNHIRTYPQTPKNSYQ